MDKYAVVIDDEKVKTGSGGKPSCPGCGGPAHSGHCGKCGTEPFEKRPALPKPGMTPLKK